MAVRDITEAKTAQKTSGKKVYFLFIFVAVVFCTYILTVCVTNFAQASDYNGKAEEFEAMAVSVSQESADISETLKPENHQAYFEKIAREDYGYCKPGEKVFYNSSYGE